MSDLTIGWSPPRWSGRSWVPNPTTAARHPVSSVRYRPTTRGRGNFPRPVAVVSREAPVTKPKALLSTIMMTRAIAPLLALLLLIAPLPAAPAGAATGVPPATLPAYQAPTPPPPASSTAGPPIAISDEKMMTEVMQEL